MFWYSLIKTSELENLRIINALSKKARIHDAKYRTAKKDIPEWIKESIKS